MFAAAGHHAAKRRVEDLEQPMLSVSLAAHKHGILQGCPCVPAYLAGIGAGIVPVKPSILSTIAIDQCVSFTQVIQIKEAVGTANKYDGKLRLQRHQDALMLCMGYHLARVDTVRFVRKNMAGSTTNHGGCADGVLKFEGIASAVDVVFDSSPAIAAYLTAGQRSIPDFNKMFANDVGGALTEVADIDSAVAEAIKAPRDRLHMFDKALKMCEQYHISRVVAASVYRSACGEAIRRG